MFSPRGINKYNVYNHSITDSDYSIHLSGGRHGYGKESNQEFLENSYNKVGLSCAKLSSSLAVFKSTSKNIGDVWRRIFGQKQMCGGDNVLDKSLVEKNVGWTNFWSEKDVAEKMLYKQVFDENKLFDQ